MINSVLARLVVTILLVFLISCSTETIKSEYDKSYNFSELLSYKWRDDPKNTNSDVRLNNDLLKNRILNAVDKELAGKGYKKQQKSGSTDFIVSYYISLDKKIEAAQLNKDYGYGFNSSSYTGAFGGGNVRSMAYTFEYLEGTLVLDIVNPENLHILWRGSFQTEIKKLKTAEAKDKRIKSAVKKILIAFPPE